eukprot:49838-Eustigmatos_ZCMA.PRE.1
MIHRYSDSAEELPLTARPMNPHAWSASTQIHHPVSEHICIVRSRHLCNGYKGYQSLVSSGLANFTPPAYPNTQYETQQLIHMLCPNLQSPPCSIAWPKASE